MTMLFLVAFVPLKRSLSCGFSKPIYYSKVNYIDDLDGYYIGQYGQGQIELTAANVMLPGKHCSPMVKWGKWYRVFSGQADIGLNPQVAVSTDEYII